MDYIDLEDENEFPNEYEAYDPEDWGEYCEDDDETQLEIAASGQIPNEGFQIRAFP